MKLSNEVKERLERIKAQLLLQGIKIKQEDLIEKIIGVAEANPILLEQMIIRQLDEEEIEEIMRVSFDLGESTEETINDDLYNRNLKFGWIGIWRSPVMVLDTCMWMIPRSMSTSSTRRLRNSIARVPVYQNIEAIVLGK